MLKQTLQELAVKDQRVLVRVDFNVPLVAGQVSDDTRLREALPTLQYLIEQGAKVILLSHLGRPKGQVMPELRLDPVAEKLSELLGQKVLKVDDCVGEIVRAAVDSLQSGEVLLLENVRFHAGETANDPAFADELAALGDFFVQEAFGTVHRAHASVVGIAERLPAAPGFLVEKEIAALSKVFTAPKKPLVLVLGGAKIDTKIGILKQFIPLADTILVGGGIANTFLAAEGYEIGESLWEEDKLEIAQELLLEANQGVEKIVLPSDVICADGTAKPDDKTPTIDIHADAVDFNLSIYDIGKEAQAKYAEIIKSAGTVVWNGPVGYFEKKPFSTGTRAVVEACLATKAETLLGGGDTLEALKQFQIDPTKFTHVSTGGGAMLEFLEGKKLPGLAVLENSKN